MTRKIGIGAAALLLIPLTAAARPMTTRQGNMGTGVKAVFDAASGKPTVYGYPLSLTFTKDDAGKMLELVADSPKSISIELWTGDIPRGSTSWTKGHEFLGNSGNTPTTSPTFKWMIEPGTYTALFVATAPAGEKPDQFLVSYGRDVHVPTAQEKAEWDKAVANYTLNRLLQAQQKRQFAPNFTAFATDRNPVSPQMYRGKVLLVQFFSGAEQGVGDEMAYIDSAYQRYRDKGFEVISVCVDGEQDTEASNFDSEFNPAWRWVYDGKNGNASIVEKYNPAESMSTYLLDTTGRIIATDLHGDRLMKAIANAVAEGAALKDATAKVDAIEEAENAGKDGKDTKTPDTAPAK